MPGLIGLSTSDGRPDGKRLHVAIRRRHLRARCNRAVADYTRPNAVQGAVPRVAGERQGRGTRGGGPVGRDLDTGGGRLVHLLDQVAAAQAAHLARPGALAVAVRRCRR